MDTVSWFDATNYCGKLTQRERAAGRISTNSVYRLPTEAEWEYACRAWTSTRFSYGDDPGYTNLTHYAWYDVNSGATTHPVGQKLPNPWGLYDMHGNVAEWCQDWYGPYPGGIALDPQGPATGSTRMGRGGLWFRPASYCRSAWRRRPPPGLHRTASVSGLSWPQVSLERKDGKLPPINLKNATVTLTWQVVVGVDHFLERSMNLGALMTFAPLATDLPGQPGTTAYTDSNTAGASLLFYRVGVGN